MKTEEEKEAEHCPLLFFRKISMSIPKRSFGLLLEPRACLLVAECADPVKRSFCDAARGHVVVVKKFEVLRGCRCHRGRKVVRHRISK